MGNTVFDRVARDYERIHDRSLPPGVSSDEFVRQKAEWVARWIGKGTGSGEFRYLDFGCGNGRLFRYLLDAGPLQPLLEAGRLRLFGVEPSIESLREAERIAGDPRVRLARRLHELPPGKGFDFIISCNVFHHIAPLDRAQAARELHARMSPGARLVIWEHNPINPLARLLVKVCPFDKEARLLSLIAVRRLFEASGCRYMRHAYLNIFPPAWQRVKFLRAIDAALAGVPVGAQFWAMFTRHE
ncbi:MAG: class I SAM-dependent methyltransferase [Desulfobacterales bacterium]|jgi:SAM-dependent methyltransferase|nr:class I SAM-dependent methyltransferase [Desulfobacterales bacterium]